MQRSPLKHRRLLQLKGAGLNTVDFLCYPPGKLDEKEIEELFKRHGRISFRQFAADPRVGNMDEKYDMTNLTKFFDYVKAHRAPFGYALINQGVDLDAHTIRGCFRWFDLYSFGIEFFIGPGNPRRIEKKTSEELIEIFGDVEYGFDAGKCHLWDGSYSGLLRELALMTRSFLTAVRPIIIEFEWHASPLGWKPDRWLFWEWRLAPADPREEMDADIWGVVNNQIRELR
jgi:hypothetical protein